MRGDTTKLIIIVKKFVICSRSFTYFIYTEIICVVLAEKFNFAHGFFSIQTTHTDTSLLSVDKKSKLTSVFDNVRAMFALHKCCCCYCCLFCFEISKHDLTSNFSACYFVARIYAFTKLLQTHQDRE